MGISGESEEDGFLLRFGLVVPGRIRGIRPPVAVLTPERGGFSQQRLEQAAAQVNRLRIALQLGRHFFGGLSTDTLTAFREISAYVQAATSSDDAWVEIHASLPDTEARALAGRAIGCLDAPDEPQQLGIDILGCLANYRQHGLGDRIADLLQRDVFWPSSLYRDARDEIAAALVQRIDEANGLQLNHLLLALAWTRGEPARRAFVEWRNDPPHWASRLHVPAEDYLHHAGWTLDANGQRRDLISVSCQRIALRANDSPTRLAVPCRTETEKRCPACGGPLAWLFDFANLPGQFFSGDRAVAPRRILCCLHCASSCPAVFSRYQSNGTADWHPATKSDETSNLGGRPPTVRELVASPQPTFAAAEPFGVEDATALGGVPMWVQDADYPHCPDCQNVMSFLAQFDNGSMTPCEEGVYYAFFCAACRVAAVNYQQT
ncbi:MAG: hypothetical protein HOP33_02935 [Verrucomicrobia bacterium]|nr:hypothetical protein [Verrucomicrobiota bacterium]